MAEIRVASRNLSPHRRKDHERPIRIHELAPAERLETGLFEGYTRYEGISTWLENCGGTVSKARKVNGPRVTPKGNHKPRGIRTFYYCSS